MPSEAASTASGAVRSPRMSVATIRTWESAASRCGLERTGPIAPTRSAMADHGAEVARLPVLISREGNDAAAMKAIAAWRAAAAATPA